jgi:hypothetical protein
MLQSPPPARSAPPTRVLTQASWQARAHVHLERAQRWTVAWRERRSRGEKHPVHDFLFEYYPYSPAKLEAWHPGPDEAVVDSPAARERFAAPEYRVAGGLVVHDPRRLTGGRLQRLRTVLRMLDDTRSRPGNFGCFGLHEWAMVYRGHEIRHADIAPLRLPQDRVDAFLESRPVTCTHFEAFRFFAPAAKPLNRIPLEWSARHDMEQPGCIHANMDLYRWAYTAMPWIGTDLLWDCFALAADLRELDMQASPYDLRALGLPPIRVETSAGRRSYQRRQRELAERAGVLRGRLIEAMRGVISATVDAEVAERADAAAP